jgi:hypothetical protein
MPINHTGEIFFHFYHICFLCFFFGFIHQFTLCDFIQMVFCLKGYVFKEGIVIKSLSGGKMYGHKGFTWKKEIETFNEEGKEGTKEKEKGKACFL